MTDCPLQYDLATRVWRCPACNWTYRPRNPGPRKPPRRNCPASIAPEVKARRAAEMAEALSHYRDTIDAEPSTLEKAKHYAAAVLQWHQAGRPVRSDSEVARIVAVCRTCARWNAETQSCRVCGCRVNESAWAIKNKARMGTERCPLGKW